VLYNSRSEKFWGEHHKAKNLGCPDTVDTNGLRPLQSGLSAMDPGHTGWIHQGAVRQDRTFIQLDGRFAAGH